jgi:glycosyltransferase involved in cell wall biosynthesis
MPTLLVLSLAAVNTPHRKPFDILAKRFGWDVHLCAPSFIPIPGAAAKTCDPAASDAAYSLHPVKLWKGTSARMTLFRGISSVVRRIQPDIVFVEYDPGSLVLIEAFLLTRGYGTKVVAYTVENSPDRRWPRAKAHILRGEIRRAVGDGLVGVLLALGRGVTDAIACLNEDGQHIYRDLWRWPQPTQLVPLGTDLELFRVRDASPRRAELGLGDAFVVGYFGRLIPEKNVHLIIEALARLPHRAKLLLDMFENFSPGTYAASLLTRATALGIRDRVVTIDVHHGQVPEHMACCDAIVLPSTETETFKEQFGRVLPEAMACGVPVVTTDAGSLRMVVGDAGLVIPRDSLDALEAALRSLMDDRALCSIPQPALSVGRPLSIQQRYQVIFSAPVAAKTRLSSEERPCRRS